MRKERDAGLPIEQLVNSGGDKPGQRKTRESELERARMRPSHSPSSQSPNRQDKNAYEWNISIAVCHGLRANLDQTDHGNQGAEIPQPAGQQCGLPIALAHDPETDQR